MFLKKYTFSFHLEEIWHLKVGVWNKLGYPGRIYPCLLHVIKFLKLTIVISPDLG